MDDEPKTADQPSDLPTVVRHEFINLTEEIKQALRSAYLKGHSDGYQECMEEWAGVSDLASAAR